MQKFWTSKAFKDHSRLSCQGKVCFDLLPVNKIFQEILTISVGSDTNWDLVAACGNCLLWSVLWYRHVIAVPGGTHLILSQVTLIVCLQDVSVLSILELLLLEHLHAFLAVCAVDNSPLIFNNLRSLDTLVLGRKVRRKWCWYGRLLDVTHSVKLYMDKKNMFLIYNYCSLTRNFCVFKTCSAFVHWGA